MKVITPVRAAELDKARRVVVDICEAIRGIVGVGGDGFEGYGWGSSARGAIWVDFEEDCVGWEIFNGDIVCDSEVEGCGGEE